MIYTKEQICVALLVELHSGLQVPVSQILRNATSFIIFSKELKFMCCAVIIYIQTIGSAKPKTFSKKTNLLNYNCKSVE